jgi:MoaA/NifB/PqqE/SkfB family radical SAM enzyme
VNLQIVNGVKQFRSESYNYNFNLTTGYFERWGATTEEDPIYSPYGAEIWDAEVSEKCNGINNIPCSFCYKGNVGNKGRNTTIDEFITMFEKLPTYNGIPFLTQVAFGIGDIDANPDLWLMMAYCRANNVVPNITINGDRLTDEIVIKLKNFCGAISVSRYDDADVCYNAVRRLKDVGMKQVNIHQMVSKETVNNCVDVMDDYLTDKRLKDLNAIVFLGLKQKGRGQGFHALGNGEFASLIKFALFHKIPIGFDSCSANKVAEVFKEMGVLEKYEQFIEPCESTAFSMYTSVDCKFFPCSFAEDVTTGIDMLAVDNFKFDVWEHKLTCCERKRIIDNGRSCPYFEV